MLRGPLFNTTARVYASHRTALSLFSAVALLRAESQLNTNKAKEFLEKVRNGVCSGHMLTDGDAPAHRRALFLLDDAQVPQRCGAHLFHAGCARAVVRHAQAPQGTCRPGCARRRMAQRRRAGRPWSSCSTLKAILPSIPIFPGTGTGLLLDNETDALEHMLKKKQVRAMGQAAGRPAAIKRRRSPAAPCRSFSSAR